MRPPIRQAGLLWLALTGAAIGAIGALFWPALTLIAPLILIPIASDWAASRLTPWVVYQLHDPHHNVIYVGQTRDTNRRMREHTDGIEHEWWQDIYGYTITRHCWTERQSERIERRRIAVLNWSSEHGSYCDPLRNEQHADRHHQASVVATLWAWKLVYLWAGLVFDSCTFHAPCGFTREIPRRRVAEEDEWWEDTEPVNQDDPIVVRYDRNDPFSNTRPTMLALPPARNETRNEQGSNAAYTGRSPVSPSPSRYVTTVTDETDSIGDRIRDASHRRRAAIVSSDTDPASPPPVSPPRRPMTNAERQKAWRERQKQAGTR